MTLTTLITVNSVLAAIIIYAVVFIHAHAVRHDRRHALGHIRPLRIASPEREVDRIAA